MNTITIIITLIKKNSGELCYHLWTFLLWNKKCFGKKNNNCYTEETYYSKWGRVWLFLWCWSQTSSQPVWQNRQSATIQKKILIHNECCMLAPLTWPISVFLYIYKSRACHRCCHIPLNYQYYNSTSVCPRGLTQYYEDINKTSHSHTQMA